MKDEKFIEPKIVINKVYTKTGDKGVTHIVGGHKVSKDSLRIKTFGDIDELMSSIGDSQGCLSKNKLLLELEPYFNRLQHELFNLGNMVATKSEDYTDRMPLIRDVDITYMENKIDYYNNQLPSLKSFVLPGGSDLSIKLHISRTICRRCERKIVELSKKEILDANILTYLNRFSDLLFVLSRWANYKLKVEEYLWDPNYKK